MRRAGQKTVEDLAGVSDVADCDGPTEDASRGDRVLELHARRHDTGTEPLHFAAQLRRVVGWPWLHRPLLGEQSPRDPLRAAEQRTRRLPYDPNVTGLHVHLHRGAYGQPRAVRVAQAVCS